MAPIRSPELEALFRRAIAGYNDPPVVQNLMSQDQSFRAVGFDADEWWVGFDDFIRVRETQNEEIGAYEVEVTFVEAFEDGDFGWGVLFLDLKKDDAASTIRATATFRLEVGVWKIVQWHNSVPVPNQQVFGVALTRTLDDLVSSVLGDRTELTGGVQGTVTLAFTDIVDSTALAEAIGDSAWVRLVTGHEAAIREVVERERGTVVKFLGDGSMLAFESATAAVKAAVAVQRSTVDLPFAVRIGIHTGEIIRTDSDLFGVAVNKAARVASAAGAHEIMISSTTSDLMGPVEGVHEAENRIVTLKGLSDAHQIIRLGWE